MYVNVMLKKLEDARSAHIKWVRRAQHLVEGLPLDESMIPVDSTECRFGEWLHSDGFRLKLLKSFAPLVEEVDALHMKLHSVYLSIYRIYFIDTKRSWLLKAILGERKEVPAHKQQEAREMFRHLEDVSSQLLQSLTKLERQLRGSNREEIARLF